VNFPISLKLAKLVKSQFGNIFVDQIGETSFTQNTKVKYLAHLYLIGYKVFFKYCDDSGNFVYNNSKQNSNIFLNKVL
jgi:hypothetical protein